MKTTYDRDRESWLFSDGSDGAFIDADNVKLTPDSAIRLARLCLDWGLREQDHRKAVARRKRAEKKETR